jgi:hypothetical protein
MLVGIALKLARRLIGDVEDRRDLVVQNKAHVGPVERGPVSQPTRTLVWAVSDMPEAAEPQVGRHALVLCVRAPVPTAPVAVIA